jgi:hypothetical protein
VVLVLIQPFGDPTAGAGALALFFAVESNVGAWWAWRKPLDPSSPEELRKSFHAVFFLAFALGESGILFTFVMAFIVDGYWPYLIGLGGFLLAMARIAPTNHNIEKKDRELVARGSRYLLSEALSQPPDDR